MALPRRALLPRAPFFISHAAILCRHAPLITLRVSLSSAHIFYAIIAARAGMKALRSCHATTMLLLMPATKFAAALPADAYAMIFMLMLRLCRAMPLQAP